MPAGADNERSSADRGGARDAHETRASRGLGASVIALLVVIGALLVLALATRTDAPVESETRKAAPTAPRGAGTPAQIRANLKQSNALIDARVDVKLAALRGVPVVVNQWASWCPPCRAEFAFFAAMAERYESQVAFLGLNSRDERGAAKAFLDEHPVPYPSIFDERARQARSIGAGASWPTTVFYDAAGAAVLIRQGGYVDAGALEADIRRHALGLR